MPSAKHQTPLKAQCIDFGVCVCVLKKPVGYKINCAPCGDDPATNHTGAGRTLGVTKLVLHVVDGGLADVGDEEVQLAPGVVRVDP